MNGAAETWQTYSDAWQRADCVHSGEVGPVMAPSHEHQLCEDFAERHPDSAEFLFAQLEHRNPYLAAYAFKCLIRLRELQPTDLPKATLHRPDKIRVLSGCVIRSQSLGSYIRGYWGLGDPESQPRPKRRLP